MLSIHATSPRTNHSWDMQMGSPGDTSNSTGAAAATPSHGPGRSEGAGAAGASCTARSADEPAGVNLTSMATHLGLLGASKQPGATAYSPQQLAVAAVHLGLAAPVSSAVPAQGSFASPQQAAFAVVQQPPTPSMPASAPAYPAWSPPSAERHSESRWQWGPAKQGSAGPVYAPPPDQPNLHAPDTAPRSNPFEAGHHKDWPRGWFGAGPVTGPVAGAHGSSELSNSRQPGLPATASQLPSGRLHPRRDWSQSPGACHEAAPAWQARAASLDTLAASPESHLNGYGGLASCISLTYQSQHAQHGQQLQRRSLSQHALGAHLAEGPRQLSEPPLSRPYLMHEDAEQHKGVSTAHLGRLEAGMSLGSAVGPEAASLAYHALLSGHTPPETPQASSELRERLLAHAPAGPAAPPAAAGPAAPAGPAGDDAASGSKHGRSRAADTPTRSRKGRPFKYPETEQAAESMAATCGSAGSGDPSSQPDVNPDSGANRRAAGAKDADAAAQRALEAEKRRLKINRESARRVRQRRQEFIERTTQQLEVLEQENARLAADFSRANITVQAMAADLRSVKQRWQATCSENAQLRQALAQVVGAGAHGEQPPVLPLAPASMELPCWPDPGHAAHAAQQPLASPQFAAPDGQGSMAQHAQHQQASAATSQPMAMDLATPAGAAPADATGTSQRQDWVPAVAATAGNPTGGAAASGQAAACSLYQVVARPLQLSTAVGGARSAPSSPGPGAGQVLPSQDTPLPALPLASAMAIERPCSAPTPFACSAAAELGVAQPPAPTPALSTSDAPSAFRQNQAGECLAPAPSLPSLVFEAADLGDDVAGDLAHELASEWQLDRLSSLPSFGQCFARVPSCALSDGTSRPHFHSGGSSPPSDLPHPPSSAQVEGCHLTSGAVSSSPSIARLPSISSPL